MTLIDKLIGDKRRYRAFRARVATLPVGHRTAVDGLSHYLMNTGPGDTVGLMTMLEDLADLFEQGAAAGTGVRELVGDDPIDFAETFKRNYGESAWMSKEHRRLTDAIAAAEAVEAAEDGRGQEP